MIEFSQLQTFLAVSKAQSFSKAAEDQFVSQSAVSQSVKNIEMKLGVNLFERLGKKVILTNEGEKLEAFALEYLEKFEHLLASFSEDKEAMAGKVRIGTLVGLGKSWLSKLVLDLGKMYPQLSLQVRMSASDILIREFEENQLDILLLPDNLLPIFGERTHISDEYAILVYPKSWENFSLPDNIVDFCKIPTILYEPRDPLYYSWTQKRFEKVPKSINSKIVINSHGSILRAVASGQGMAIIPTHVFERSDIHQQVAVLEDSKISNGKLSVLYHKEAFKSKRFQIFVDALKSSRNPF